MPQWRNWQRSRLVIGRLAGSNPLWGSTVYRISKRRRAGAELELLYDVKCSGLGDAAVYGELHVVSAHAWDLHAYAGG